MDNANEKLEAKVALIQLTLPGYRTAFIEGLKGALPGMRVAAGISQLDPTVGLGLPRELVDISLINRFFLRRRLAYQPGARRALLPADVWLLELNPRVINTWLALLEARLRGRRALLWGHFVGRRNNETGPRFARRWQVRLASGVIAYTFEDRDRFASFFPGVAAYCGPNAIERSSQIPPPGRGPRDSFLYVGRLVEAKGLETLVEAFRLAVAASLVPATTRLVLVGDGPLRQQLLAAAERSKEDFTIEVLPGTFSAAQLNCLYDSAIAGVCAGYVGLNLTQSLSRGVPFVYPLRAPHAPEVVLAAEGRNAFSFEPTDACAMSEALGAAWRSVQSGALNFDQIQRDVLERYSVERMVEGFVDAILAG